MDDILYLVSVAFGGSDVWRAVWMSLLASLFCSAAISPIRMGVFVFLIDRLWPFLGMGFAGYGAGDIAAALSYTLRMLPADAVPLMVRGLGILLMVYMGYHLRLALHGQRPVLRPVKIPLPY